MKFYWGIFAGNKQIIYIAQKVIRGVYQHDMSSHTLMYCWLSSGIGKRTKIIK